MTEREALINAIVDAWEDNTPRLVYADWVEEGNGDEVDKARAEYIRVSLRGGRKSTVVASAKEKEWLSKNYVRLLPGHCFLHVKYFGNRSLRACYPCMYGGKLTYNNIQLRVDRGFVSECRWPYPRIFFRDMNIVAPHFPGAAHTRTSQSLSVTWLDWVRASRELTLRGFVIILLRNPWALSIVESDDFRKKLTDKFGSYERFDKISGGVHILCNILKFTMTYLCNAYNKSLRDT